jgi:hypothetical protein
MNGRYIHPSQLLPLPLHRFSPSPAEPIALSNLKTPDLHVGTAIWSDAQHIG